jgi:hypothetical protein
MPPLGDSFPEEFRRRFAEKNLKVGSVIRAIVKDTTPPKTKRFILIGISGDKLAVATLYLNTEINPNVFTTNELRNLHLKMEAIGRSYLSHDSFADCSKVYEKEFAEILKVLESDASSILGELNAADLDQVKQTVKIARTISVHVKKKYGLL